MTRSSKSHDYEAHIVWTGNTGDGTRSYRGYDRSWEVRTPGKPVIRAHNDPLLGGDASLHNPEDMLLASLAACHMLWYLHLAMKAGIVVTDYTDQPLGTGETSAAGAGRFVRALLRPEVTITEGADPEQAAALHAEVHRYCFIARSVNFPVEIEPTIRLQAADQPGGS